MTVLCPPSITTVIVWFTPATSASGSVAPRSRCSGNNIFKVWQHSRYWGLSSGTASLHWEHFIDCFTWLVTHCNQNYKMSEFCKINLDFAHSINIWKTSMFDTKSYWCTVKLCTSHLNPPPRAWQGHSLSVSAKASEVPRHRGKNTEWKPPPLGTQPKSPV